MFKIATCLATVFFMVSAISCENICKSRSRSGSLSLLTLLQVSGKLSIIRETRLVFRQQYILTNNIYIQYRLTNWRASFPRRRRSLYPVPRRGRRGRPASGYHGRRRSTSCPDTGLPSIGVLSYSYNTIRCLQINCP